MRKYKKFYILILIIYMLIIPINTFAHSGRTDSNGGHWDRSTGTYHYHNGTSVQQNSGGSYQYNNSSDSNKILNNNSERKDSWYIVENIFSVIFLIAIVGYMWYVTFGLSIIYDYKNKKKTNNSQKNVVNLSNISDKKEDIEKRQEIESEIKTTEVKVETNKAKTDENIVRKNTINNSNISKNNLSKKRCPSCGATMVLRKGKYGLFYGCTRYPYCKGTRNY